MRKLALTVMLLLFISPVWASAWEDNFDDGSMHEWTDTGEGAWWIDDGELVMQSIGPMYGFRTG
jgi:hypothetical protein